MCKINFINKKNIVMILFQIKNILKNNYYHIKHLLSYPSNKDFKLLGSCFSNTIYSTSSSYGSGIDEA
jgi:hypothetical protein